MLQDVTRDYHETLFDDLGAVRGTFRHFEEGTIARFWSLDHDAGVFVAFDGRPTSACALHVLVGKHYE
ncbi:hypothetical protein [Halarchaeum nitratireducens]|uniref:hypothetical protein n=1 Tax=Halarchaeum nitratireducens TaxID=489913 RepID=UPI0016646399|nr:MULTISPECIES: hypothetical protein [Halarchaeum]MBP2251420.1 hypothetical protein [Halarchaeum solikamskense]